MKVREVVDKINDIKKTQELLHQAMKNEKDGSVTFIYALAEDIDDKLDELVELWGFRDLK